MTINYTNFLSLLVQAFPDFVTDVNTSTWQEQFDSEITFGVEAICAVQDVVLNNGGSYSIPIPGLSGASRYLFAVTCTSAIPSSGVVAQAQGAYGYLLTSGLDQDGVTSITGAVPLYGALLPSGPSFQGIVFVTTSGLTGNPEIFSLIDNSIFQVFVMQLTDS